MKDVVKGGAFAVLAANNSTASPEAAGNATAAATTMNATAG
jgi:hypothetical protein